MPMSSTLSLPTTPLRPTNTPFTGISTRYFPRPRNRDLGQHARIVPYCAWAAIAAANGFSSAVGP